MRPGQTAKGSFKNSKSKGKAQVFVPNPGFLFGDWIKNSRRKLKFQGKTENSSLNPKKLALFVYNFLDIFMQKSKDLQAKLRKLIKTQGKTQSSR